MSRRKRQHFIPEERYDIDGTLVKNEAAIKAKQWNLGDILRDPKARSRAIKEAQTYIKENKGKLELDNNNKAWSEETDEIFFSRKRKGLAAMMPQGSPIYFEFEGFYIKLKESLQTNQSITASSKKKYELLQREGELLRHALILFQDFQNKKRIQLKEKLEMYRVELPITGYTKAILHTLAKHRIILIAGDTGCGKSTQVPQILMQAGYQKIACTQPRRIACSSLARRVSYETLNEFGSQIAYQVRFEGTKTKRTRILFLTEGLLLRHYAMDPLLSMYDVIIVDEVHERHMMGDFLLALLKRLLTIRNDLHVVLMSATINAELFAHYFDAPTLTIPGRMYPVKIHYWNEQKKEDKNLINDAAYQRRQRATIKESIPSRTEKIDPGPYLKVLDYIDQSIPVTERGDLLIFMSGINEISSLADELKKYAEHNKKWIILMLHSTLAVDEQDKVFDIPPEGVRKCIISSNIAETSLTIDGIRFVIDSGKVKELSHDATSNMSKLSEFWISKASAKQRTGRSGRTGPGECFRFYSENEFEHFNDFAVPEIQRAPLEPLLLQMKALELGDARTFDYVEAPGADAINASMDFLQNLGAIDNKENIMGLGIVLANLPVDAIIGKMLLMATVFNLVDPIITIAASMSVQSPFSRLSLDSHSDILKNRRKFDSEHGDPFTLLNVWQEWLNAKTDRKTSSRNWCRKHGIEEHRLYEIAKMRRQFEKVLNDFQPGLLQHLKEQQHMNSDEEREQRKHRLQKRDQLKREKYEERSNKKRRVLTMEYEEQEDWQEEGHNLSDIRDLEFTMTNNLKHLVSRATPLDKRDINLIKLIICSALYPQLAIGDEHNPYRKSNEIIFHTPVKKFLSIHPTSVIAAHPDWVQGLGDNIRKDDLAVEQAMQHQLLCYLQLLETNKPYLLGLTRVPGIHTLLLFSKTIDTNKDCSVLVFDAYYMVKFKTTAVAEHVLYLAYKLRLNWLYLLNKRIRRGLGEQLNENNVKEEEEELIITPSLYQDLPQVIQKMIKNEKEKENNNQNKMDMWTPAIESEFQEQVNALANQLAIAMETAISADFKVAKPSELLKMYPKYTRPIEEESNIPRAWNSKDVVREGIRITSNLYYNSLNEPSSASNIPIPEDTIPLHIKMYWYCPHCDSTFSFTRSEILDHLAKCE